MRLHPVGTRALLVELDDLEAVQRLYAHAQERRRDGRLPAVDDVVPAARTVLFDGVERPVELARDIAGWQLPPVAAGRDRVVEVPTTYDGPDLDEVARHWQLTTREVVAAHLVTDHVVAFLGFAPGFAYVTGTAGDRAVPRRRKPRTRVPPGSVGFAGRFTGIYPRESPGGWQLVGRTRIALWDPAREPAALLAPGTRVRFVEAPR